VLVTGEADMAIGGDNGGSIRIPASWSGCYGLKPTWGLVPWTGAFSIETTIDHLGPMAMNVQDCASLLSVIAGADGLDPRQPQVTSSDYLNNLEPSMKGKRVGIVTEAFGWEGMSQPDVDATVREAAKRYESLGASVEEVSVPMHRDGIVIWSAIAHEGGTYKMVASNAMGTNAKGYYSVSLAEAYGKARGAQSRDYPNTVKLTAMIGAYMSRRYNVSYYAKGQNLSRRLKESYDNALTKYDVLVFPTTPMKAMPQLGGDTMEEYFATTLGMLTNTAPLNVSGHPAISVPVGTSEGLPVGMTIMGRHFDDQTVLSAALAFQESLSK
jgi:amidase